MPSPKKIKVVLAGGGSSSGHVTPLVAVAEELKKYPAEVLWIGDTTDRTRQWAAEAGVGYAGIPSGKFHRYWTLANLKTPFLYWAGARAARRILTDFRPDVVFAKGGSVSLPVVAAATRLSIPIIIHESDAVMGLANRRATKAAQKICVSWPVENYPDLPRDKLVFTGVPIRSEFLRVTAAKHTRAQLLVTGGGQGAVPINDLVFQALPELLKMTDVVHLTGERSFPKAETLVQDGYRPIAYVSEEMAQLVADADLILSRASATTLAEIAAVGRPAILVPLPSAANDHQRANARVWRTAGAAEVIEESDLTPRRLVAAAEAIFTDRSRRAAMGRAARSLGLPDAARKIAALIMETR